MTKHGNVLHELFEAVYGYDFGELVAFATICRQEGITSDELHDLVTSVREGYRIGMEMMRKNFRIAQNKQGYIYGYIDESDPFGNGENDDKQ